LVELELTESVVFQYTGVNQTLLQRLKRFGIQLAVDDFGQGYSTLSHLSHLPFDKIKMDKAFADNIAGDNNDSVVAAGIINIANRLGMTVVAEGVETNEQLVQYQMQGCNHVQGWIFSRAVDPNRIGEMLESGLFDNYQAELGGNHGLERLV
jgi:EAL domain-containing protein (putative c-di-GMP-specific phosphodiesterase class I)